MGGREPRGGCKGRLKHQRVNAHREAAQFNGIVSGRPASAWGKAIARTGPPDTTFFISVPRGGLRSAEQRGRETAAERNQFATKAVRIRGRSRPTLQHAGLVHPACTMGSACARAHPGPTAASLETFSPMLIASSVRAVYSILLRRYVIMSAIPGDCSRSTHDGR